MDNPTQPLHPSSEDTPVIHPETRSTSHIKRNLLIAGLIILILLLGGSAYPYTTSKKPATKSNALSQAPTKPITDSQSLPSQTNGKIFSGSIKKLTENLGLFVDSNNPQNIATDVSYYQAGVFKNGQYEGYTRYVAVREPFGPGEPPSYIFASKDKKTFIIDFNPDEYQSINTPSAPYELTDLNTSKVTSAALLPTEHDSLIQLDDKFTLWRDTMMTMSYDTGKKDSNGGIFYDSILRMDFSPFQKLRSPLPYLTMYQSSALITDFPVTPTPEPFYDHIGGKTVTYVIDSTGLAYQYILANKKTANVYQAQYDEYKRKMKLYNQKKLGDLPDYPIIPNLRMSASELSTNNTTYSTYDLALPGGCAYGGGTYVAKNITDSGLKKIGTSPEGDIYILRDTSDVLLKRQYYLKISSIADADKRSDPPSNMFGDINKGKTPPSYEEYLQKNPLLFIKDYWGRWVIIGEYDYQLLGGCGKPVIYLYPPKPTKVHIQFETPITFSHVIPNYHNGWDVLAQPNGMLSDLQPQYTDCGAINGTEAGLEYAPIACRTNAYPYLFWSGNSLSKPYPSITKGWYVTRADLSHFISTKLDEIGFNPTEKHDFLNYWLPQMLSHTEPYFRISFLQNNEMNSIAPMRVSPNPDHYYRYFLDFLPLETKPQNAIEPQDLMTIRRDGFTLVEWGGLKR